MEPTVMETEKDSTHEKSSLMPRLAILADPKGGDTSHETELLHVEFDV